MIIGHYWRRKKTGNLYSAAQCSTYQKPNNLNGKIYRDHLHFYTVIDPVLDCPKYLTKVRLMIFLLKFREVVN